MNYLQLIEDANTATECVRVYDRISFNAVDHNGIGIQEVKLGLARKGIAHARHIAKLSKDPSTQVGAVIMDKDAVIYSTGYNGFPRGFPDSNYEDREFKYPRVVHAEANAIINLARTGASLPSYPIIFVSGAPPCCECAKLICQLGIKEVIFDAESEFHQRHAAQTIIALELFNQCGVDIGCVEYSQMGSSLARLLTMQLKRN